MSNKTINTFDYSKVTEFTKDVIHQMYNSQIDPRGEDFELEESLLGKNISKSDLELILKFYCTTPITTIEQDRSYPKLKKEMWNAYHTYGKHSEEYMSLKRDFEELDLTLTPTGRQRLIDGVVNKKEVTYFPNLYTNAPKYLSVEEALNLELNKFKEIWNSLDRFNCAIIQNNFDYPTDRVLGNLDGYEVSGKINYINKLNAMFALSAQSTPNLYLNDINLISHFLLRSLHGREKRFFI